MRWVEDEYFRTLEIPLRRGRVFNEQDRPGTPRAAVINESMARRFRPGQDPLGKHMGAGSDACEIVGVVADVRHQDATKEGLVEVFFPYRQAPPKSMTVVVRAGKSIGRDPMRLGPAIGRAVAAVDGQSAPSRVRELLQIASGRLAPKRLTMAVIAAFAGLALVLAAIGIYGVLSFTVAQRTHEIGVRMALGAPRGSVVRMIVGQAAGLAAGGVAIGIAGALAVSHVLASLLYGVQATDPVVFAGVSAMLLGVAVTAAYLPARRAAKVDPVTALRHE
ncbi:MAG: ABC transporter permease [Acidobacteriia bacterium]|nr:ABC transporter permease [Terriglobia bacterium]